MSDSDLIRELRDEAIYDPVRHQAANTIERLTIDRDRYASDAGERAAKLDAALELRDKWHKNWQDAEAEIERLTKERNGYRWHLDRCEQIAGRALGYPKYADDQKNFPGATEADGVCIGEHVGDTIVAELATALAKAREALEWYSKQVRDCRKITSEGEDARHALEADGGQRARAALTSESK